MQQVDVAIIGAGPAGLFAAHEILSCAEPGTISVKVLEQGRTFDERVCPAKEQGRCVQCEPCHTLGGLGGAGLFSDGKLVDLRYLSHPSERIHDGGIQKFHYIEEAFGALDIPSLLERVERITQSTGISPNVAATDEATVARLQDAFRSAGLRFEYTEVQHIGTDRLPQFVGRLADFLLRGGASLSLNGAVRDIRPEEEGFALDTDDGPIRAHAVIVATGRGSVSWLRALADRIGLAYRWDHVDIGVRVETSPEILRDLFAASRDPKLHFTASSGRVVRTFCMCDGGTLVPYVSDGVLNVGGASPSNARETMGVCNFGVLVKIMGSTLGQTYGLGLEYAQEACSGAGLPLVEPYRTFVDRGWPRPERLKCSSPFWGRGSLSKALPPEILSDIREFLWAMESIVADLPQEKTVVVGPVVEWPVCEYTLSPHGETAIPGLFIAGDVSGRIQGIVAGAVSGIVAARKAMERLS